MTLTIEKRIENIESSLAKIVETIEDFESRDIYRRELEQLESEESLKALKRKLERVRRQEQDKDKGFS